MTLCGKQMILAAALAEYEQIFKYQGDRRLIVDFGVDPTR